MENQENSLEVVIKENGIEVTQAQFLLGKFTPLLKSLTGLTDKAKTINITDVSQVKEMAEAREVRLQLKGIRVETEKTRKDLKERALKEGRAIDGLAAVIKDYILPLEESLEKQEKFIENIELEKQARIKAERAAELGKYVEDITLYNYEAMSDEAFTKLVAGLKTTWEAEQAEIKKAELKKIEDDKKKEEEAEKTRLENIKLKKEAEDRDKKEAKEKADREAKEKKEREEREEKDRLAEEQRKKDKEESDKKIAKEREENEKKLQIEREAREKIERENRERTEREAKEKAEKEEKERQAKLAPEKEKLFFYSEEIKALRGPSELSVAGRAIVEDAEKQLLKISQEIKLKLKNL